MAAKTYEEAGVRAWVETDFAMLGVSVTIAHPMFSAGNRYGVMIKTPTGSEVVEEGTSYGGEPTIRLRDDEALALLDALLTHYRGGSDTRQLRKDYEAERARVDRLINYVIEEPA